MQKMFFLITAIVCVALTGCAAAASRMPQTGSSPAQPPSIGSSALPADMTATRLPPVAIPPALAAISIPLPAEPLNLEPLMVEAKKHFPSKQIRIILPDRMYTQEFSPDRINLQLTPNATHTQLVVSRIYPG